MGGTSWLELAADVGLHEYALPDIPRFDDGGTGALGSSAAGRNRPQILLPTSQFGRCQRILYRSLRRVPPTRPHH